MTKIHTWPGPDQINNNPRQYTDNVKYVTDLWNRLGIVPAFDLVFRTSRFAEFS